MKDFSFGNEARQKLLQGATILSKLVASSLGPKGRNTLIEQSLGEPILTKDGVTIANNVFSDDHVENMAMKVIKQAANNTNNQAGDGTTTTTVLSYNLLKRGITAVNDGVNPVQLKKGMDKALVDVKEKLKELSEKITTDLQVEQIATISANGDVETAKLVSTAVSKVGLDGIITIDVAKGFEDTIETTQGMKIDRGYLSPYFVNNQEKSVVEMKNPLILLINDKIISFNDYVNVLTEIQQSGRPLLIIAEDYESDPLNTLIANKVQGALDIVAIKAQGFGDNKTDILEDIAILTGGTVLSPNTIPVNQSNISHCGTCESLTVSKNDTIIIDSKNIESVLERVELLKKQVEASTNEHHIKNLKNRIARLTGGVAVLKITAQTDIELKEKKYRLEDALNACRASIEEGIVPGGGNTLAYIGKTLKENKLPTLVSNSEFLSEAEKTGYVIVLDSLSAPFIEICYNAGLDGEKLLQQLTEPNVGVDALEGTIVTLKENGIIDPTKVERVACENSISVASSLLTTECTITNKPKQ